MQAATIHAAETIVQGLQNQIEAIREKAESDIAILWGAIELIQGRQNPPPIRSTPLPPARGSAELNPAMTIPEMILQAAEVLGDVVLDHGPLREKAIELHPGDAEKIKRGVYPAVTSLTKQGKFVKGPGGWKLAKYCPPQAPA